MERDINPIIINREVKTDGSFTSADVFIANNIENQIQITIAPSWKPLVIEEHKQLQTISGNNVLVLNLNHINVYGHIYTEVFSELCAVDETYPEYDCVLTLLSPLMIQIIKGFNLKLSNKIKFVLNNGSQTPFILEFKKLKIVNHCPRSYSNKVKNINKLKNLIHTAVPIVEKEKNLLLYCSRSNKKTATHGRKITPENEEQVVNILAQYASENNLEFYFWNGLELNGTTTSVLKQYELFSNAKLVVGVHGGAFSNIIFIDPLKSPKVIEFCPSIGKSFIHLSEKAFCCFSEYNQILFQLSSNAENLNERELIELLKNEDSTIDVSKLKTMLA